MKILIVDDQLPNRLIAKFLVESDGHTCIEAEDGQDALEKYMQARPDFVLMDIVMPVMDGYQAAYYIKNYAGEQHVPIIFLTAKHDEASLTKCLESGGDDYLVKPINGTLLKAKIRAHERTLELTQQVQTKNKELTAIYASLSKEHEMGHHVLQHALKRNLKNCVNVKTYLSSMSYFNGDLFLLAEHPHGGLYVFLGDFTGHGLSAAMGTIPVSQLFFSLCEQGKSVSTLISALNASLKNFLPEHMFCAATLIHMHEKGESAHIWSGGLPDAYIVRPGQGISQKISSKNLPLGILADDKFTDEPQYYRFRSGDHLLLLSDGILEAINPESEEMFGEERLESVLNKGQGNLIDSIVHAYQEHASSEKQKDDLSLVEILALPYEAQYPSESVFKERSVKHLMPWSVSVELDAEKIKHIDVVVELMNILPSFIRITPRFEDFKTVFSEIYSNALEHGVLQLSSRLKNTSAGFAEYYLLRQKKLAQLQNGSIKFTLTALIEGDKLGLKLELEDSGDGFDFEQSLLANSNSAEQLWGRGLALVNTLSESMIYSEHGKKVEVIVNLTQC
ncbi:MAG: SpoIIE family protein phosphatase [Oleiphilus sp.]